MNKHVKELKERVVYAIDNTAEEFDLSLADILGVLEGVKLEYWHIHGEEGGGEIDDGDDDDEPEPGEEWKRK